MKEIRTQQQQVNSTSNDSRLVEGYAVVFNSLSNDLGGFKEIIEPDAIDDDVIKCSDILCLLDHNKERGVLARAQFGEGSLKLELDSHGLKYSFEAPKTALGDEILESLRRGDISKCSFAFVVEKDNWEKQDDGTIIRHIIKIKQLYDVSLVYNPAYEETEVKADLRGLKELQERDNNINDISNMDDKKELIEQLKTIISKLSDEEKPKDENEENEVEIKKENEEEKPDSNDEEVNDNKETVVDNTDEQPKENEEENVSETVEPDKENEEETEEEKRNITDNNIYINMKKNKFSLIQTINDVVNNRNLNDAALSINKEGRSAMAKSGLAVNGQIVLPVVESRDGELDAEGNPNGVYATIATAGKENVATDKLDILEPLRANMVLSKAGATYLTGLVGDVSIPTYSGSNVSWEGEIAPAKKGNGKWGEVKLQPKRLTAYVDVSKQFLLQDSNDAEEMLKRDIINAISEKLEQTIFGDGAGSDTTPTGIFNGVTAMTAAVTYSDIVDAEADLNEANVNDFVYVLSPKAKATFRTLSKDAGSGRMVMEGNEIEGVKALVSSAVKAKGFVVGDFRDYVVAQWGALDVVVDPYTKAAEGQIRLVINAYFDAKPRRSSAFVAKILK